MVIFGLLLVALIGAIVFWAVKLSGAHDQRPAVAPATGSARDVLDLRLARGEVSPEEYGTLRTLLGP